MKAAQDHSRVICTIQFGSFPFFDYTAAAMRRYAERVGADFLVMHSPTLPVALNEKASLSVRVKASLQKLELQKLLERYERALYLDADIIVTPNAPNVFEEYPDSRYSYLLDEGLYVDRSLEIEKICSELGKLSEWTHGVSFPTYYNTGVMLISRESSFLTHLEPELAAQAACSSCFVEQCYFNYAIQKYRTPVQSLDCTYNFIAEAPNHERRSEAAFVHYAGSGFGPSRTRVWQMLWDYHLWYRQTGLKPVSSLKLLREGLSTMYHAPSYPPRVLALKVRNSFARKRVV